jgi:hypothetical protein
MDLKVGVICYVTFELMFWGFMAAAAVSTEAQFFSNYDLYKFEEQLEESWYYAIIFGLPGKWSQSTLRADISCINRYRRLLSQHC